MDKPTRYKAKNKKQPAPKLKNTKKRKSEGPTCSMFLAELTRKLAVKKKQEAESPTNIVQMIVDSITNALPIKISRRPSKKDSPMKIETLQTFAPELLPNDTLNIPLSEPLETDSVVLHEVPTTSDKMGFKMPKMPLVSSELIKVAVERRKKPVMQDATINTSADHDVASEITKHVNTLRKISLIAEEFNQKTAKNLKEIVDSVQQDLIKKLEEIQAEQKLQAESLKIEEEKKEGLEHEE